MYIIKTENYFDSAHFLKDYDGKCANIHGHRWCVTVEVASDTLSVEKQTRGMVVDFSSLKTDLKSITESLDHCLIIEESSLKASTLAALDDEGFKIVSMPFRPTAENFAKFFYDKMTEKGHSVLQTTVYETENNCARYRA